MPTILKTKNSVTATNAPSSLEQGELAVNITDKKVWVGNAATTPVQLLGTGASANFSALSCTTLSASGTTTLSANAIISVTDNSNAALRITQLGTGNALLVEDSTNPDATPFVIDSSGNVVIGTTSPSSTAYSLFIESSTGLLTSTGSNSGTTSPTIGTSRRRTGGASVISGDSLGKFNGFGWDAANYIEAARIETFVDGTPSTNDMPGRLVFSTTADGASSVTERMRITSAGEVLVGGTKSILSSDGLTIQKATVPKLALFRDDTSIVAGNSLGNIEFYGNDTTSNTPTLHAFIQALPSGTHAAGDNPTDIVFATTPDGTETAAEAVRIKDGGGLQISRTAVTAPATGDGNVFSGTYTPTLTNSTNVASSTASELQYMRVGSVVTVSGLVVITPTAASDANTVLRMSLPISSNLANTTNLSGTGVISSAAGRGVAAAIYADSTNDLAEFNFLSPSTSGLSTRFTFTYRII
jgi:hypothetical protein